MSCVCMGWSYYDSGHNIILILQLWKWETKMENTSELDIPEPSQWVSWRRGKAKVSTNKQARPGFWGMGAKKEAL